MTGPAAGTAPAKGAALAVPPSPEGAFDTDALRADLKTRSVRSGFVNLLSQGVQVTAGVGGTMVLARLLTPADFGLYAMVAILMTFVGNFRDFGLPLATMHREAVTHAEYSALFWLYQRINVLIGLTLLAMGPVLAWFYDEPALVGMTAAMAAGVFVLGLAVQHESLLKRQMRFGALAYLDIAGTALGVVLAIAAALLGAGYWALVVQFVVMCLIKAVGAWAVLDWRPGRPRPRGSAPIPGLRGLLSYGKDVTGARVVGEVGRNLDRLLVGYLAGAQSLGLYHYAFKWSHFPTKQLFIPLNSVAVAGLSRVHGDTATYRNYFRRGVMPVFTLALPAIAFLFVEADAVLGVLLGPRWLDAVPLFRILCVAAFVGKVNTVTKWVYLSSGETRRQLHWAMISTPILVASVSIGATGGVRGVAIGFTVGTGLLILPGVWFCLRRSSLHAVDFVSALWRPVVVSIVAAAALLSVRGALVPGANPVITLMVHMAVFAAVLVGAWLLLPGGWSAAREMQQLIGARRGARRGAPEQPEE